MLKKLIAASRDSVTVALAHKRMGDMYLEQAHSAKTVHDLDASLEDHADQSGARIDLRSRD